MPAAAEHKIETLVAAALTAGNPGAAIDFTSILAIITALLPIIGNCMPGNAMASIKAGDVFSKVACYRATLEAGLPKREALDVALRLSEAAKSVGDVEIAGLLSRARDFC